MNRLPQRLRVRPIMRILRTPGFATAIKGCVMLTMSLGFVTWASDPSRGVLDGLELQGLNGQTLKVAGTQQQPYTAFIFISRTCPIANAYQPRLRELQSEFERQGVRFVQVYVQPDITSESAQTHVKEFDLKSLIVLDPQRKLATALSAKVTPEAIVVDRHGSILYRGRIDDQFAALGKKRPQPTRNDLEIALREITSGKEVSVPSTTAIGCIIHY